MDSSMVSKCDLPNAWLVVCGDMLLLIGLLGRRSRIVITGETLEVLRLDLSTEPALWLKMDKVEYWAIFISTGKRSQALSCMNPVVWGGRSNCIYCYDHESKRWTTLELGKPLRGHSSESNSDIFIYMGRDSRLQTMWVFPQHVLFASVMVMILMRGCQILFGAQTSLQICKNLSTFCSSPSANFITWAQEILSVTMIDFKV
uniref:Uncharacterized protein n=1 Tax=Avena sativa TaxID=4498 RepID=A0ACD5Y050_AVESA